MSTDVTELDQRVSSADTGGGRSSGRARDALMLGVLVGCGLSVSLIFTAIGPVLSSLSTLYGGAVRGDVIAQLIMTLPSIGVIVGGPIAGVLAGRWGARPLLLASLIAYGLLGCGGVIVEQAHALLTTRLLLGAAAVAVSTAATALIGDLLSGLRRTRALGLSSAIASLGSIVSIMIAGRLAAYGGPRLPFAIYGVVAVTLLVGALLFVPQPPRVAAAGTQSTPVMRGIAILAPIYAALIAVTIVVFMTGIQVSFLLAAKGIAEPVDQAWIIASASIGAAIGGFVYTTAQRYLGPDWTFIACVAIMGIGNVVLGSQGNQVLLAIGCAMNGLGAGMTIPHFGSKIMERAPHLLRPRALGLMYTMIFLGEFLNPWIVTPLHLKFGIDTAFVIVGAAALAAAAFVSVFEARR